MMQAIKIGSILIEIVVKVQAKKITLKKVFHRSKMGKKKKNTRIILKLWFFLIKNGFFLFL